MATASFLLRRLACSRVFSDQCRIALWRHARLIVDFGPSSQSSIAFGHGLFTLAAFHSVSCRSRCRVPINKWSNPYPDHPHGRFGYGNSKDDWRGDGGEQP